MHETKNIINFPGTMSTVARIAGQAARLEKIGPRLSGVRIVAANSESAAIAGIGHSGQIGRLGGQSGSFLHEVVL
jgi:hypothetical protein